MHFCFFLQLVSNIVETMRNVTILERNRTIIDVGALCLQVIDNLKYLSEFRAFLVVETLVR